jgi:hypothetical protein
MFLALSELEQEALANIGDDHVAESAMALAYAINPSLAHQDGQTEKPDESEASLARRLAEGLIGRLSGQPSKAPPPLDKMPTETLAGFGGRRVEKHIMPERPKLFGREPDHEVVAP